jgi:hypothetical protein
MNDPHSSRRTVASLLAIGLLVAACAGGGAAPAPPSVSSAPPSAVGSEPGDSTPPDGTVTSPPDTRQDPGAGGPTGGFVVAKPGQLDLHPIGIDSFAARVDGTTIVVTATWTSGVEPCNVLDHIQVQPGAGTYTITILEGHGPEQVACIEIAQIKKTEFEIPAGRSGSYTLLDSQKLAAPLEVKIP